MLVVKIFCFFLGLLESCRVSVWIRLAFLARKHSWIGLGPRGSFLSDFGPVSGVRAGELRFEDFVRFLLFGLLAGFSFLLLGPPYCLGACAGGEGSVCVCVCVCVAGAVTFTRVLSVR